MRHHKNLTVLLTGSCGYLGTEICSHLLSLGYSVIALDSLRYHQGCHNIPLFPYFSHENPNSGKYEFHKGDVRYFDLMKTLVQRADVVIHLAALVGMSVCDKYFEEAKEVNYESVVNLTSILSERQFVIFPDTNSFYGNAGDEICTEQTKGKPLSHYAKTKYAAEQYLLEEHANTTVLRLATVFGTSGRTRLDLLVNDLAYQAYFNQKLTLYEPHVRRNFVHVSDVALCMSELINLNMIKGKDTSGVFNFGNDGLNMTKENLFAIVGNYFGVDVELIDGTDSDKRNYNVSSNKLKSELGISAVAGILDGLDQLNEWFDLLPQDKSVRESLLKYNRNI